MASINEVAREAGVSASTVSRVLNYPDLVKPVTRESVFSAISLLDYAPASKRRRKNNIIGLAVSDIRIPLVAKMMLEIEEELKKTPYDLLIFNMNTKKEIHKFFRKKLGYRKKFDGLIVFSADLDRESLDFFHSLDIPVVLLQNRCQGEKSISTNNYQGAFDAVNFLIRRDYNKIAFIGWEPEDDHIIDRFHGYKNAIEKGGLPFHERYTTFSSLNTKGGYLATRELFNNSRPDAIFYASDSLAFGGYQYFREKGITVPRDIGIVGFDDLEMASVFALTTMNQFVQVKARMAVSYLIDRLSGKLPRPLDEEIWISPKLVIRGSTR